MRASSSPARRAGPGVTRVTTVSRSRGPRPGCWGEKAASSQPSLALLVAHRCRSGATLLDRTGRMEPAPTYRVAQVFLAVKKESGEINTPPPPQTTEKYLGEKKFPSKTGRAGRGQVCTELAPLCWDMKANSQELCISSHVFYIH